MKDLDSIRLMR